MYRITIRFEYSLIITREFENEGICQLMADKLASCFPNATVFVQELKEVANWDEFRTEWVNSSYIPRSAAT